jgi:L-alanine-DL-glutamate epimerase-like enolase superfamily enzyme
MRITGIETTLLGLPFKVPYHWAGRCDFGAHVVLIEVETDEGIIGVGESTAASPPDGTVGFLEGIKKQLVGESPFDIERLLHRVRCLGSFTHTPWFANLTLAGLEMALWDVIGKAADRPVYQLMGGAYREEVDYFGFLQGDTADELAHSAEETVAAGYSVIYMKVGRGDERDMRNVAAVREVIGDRRLRLDANEAWDVATAIRMINRLTRFEPEFVEQPTPGHSILALEQVKDAVGVAIAADQCVFTVSDVFDICRLRAADVIVLSVHETGGLLGFKKAAAVAEAAGISMCLHGQSVTGVTDCAQHQVGLTVPNLTDGNQIMHQLIEEDILVAPDITPREGKIGLLDRPGLGFELNRDAVERARQRAGDLRPTKA